MKERKTLSMLQRVPMILAVTAASYGLPLQQAQATQRGTGNESIARPAAASGQAAQQGRVVRPR